MSKIINNSTFCYNTTIRIWYYVRTDYEQLIETTN